MHWVRPREAQAAGLSAKPCLAQSVNCTGAWPALHCPRAHRCQPTTTMHTAAIDRWLENHAVVAIPPAAWGGQAWDAAEPAATAAGVPPPSQPHLEPTSPHDCSTGSSGKQAAQATSCDYSEVSLRQALLCLPGQGPAIVTLLSICPEYAVVKSLAGKRRRAPLELLAPVPPASSLDPDSATWHPESQQYIPSKFWARRDHLLPAGLAPAEFSCDWQGWYSVTPRGVAQLLAQRVPPRASCVVLDVCAGVGGDTLAWAQAGHRVVAVETDAARAAALRSNVSSCAARVHVVCGDAIALAKSGDLTMLGAACCDGTPTRRPFNVALCAPPWGGMRQGRAATSLHSIALDGQWDGVDMWRAVSPLANAVVLLLPANAQLDHVASQAEWESSGWSAVWLCMEAPWTAASLAPASPISDGAPESCTRTLMWVAVAWRADEPQAVGPACAAVRDAWDSWEVPTWCDRCSEAGS